MDFGDVDRVLASAVDRGVAPGVVALAADDSGDIYARAFGVRGLDGDAEMSLGTVFSIASMTKPVTAVAAMQLVEDGRVDLDEPLGDRVPELLTVRVLEGFDDQGVPRLRPARETPTMRQLLSHTAGFAYHIWNADILRYCECTGTPTIDKRKLACFSIPKVRDCGERWEYGINVDWAARVVEHLSGQTLEAYFRERILDPLGMTDTTFVLSPELHSRLATRHARQPDGSLEPLPFTEAEAPEVFEGGGGLYSTGPDYLRFQRMLMGGGELDGVRILRPETVAEMMQNQIGDLTVGSLVTALPEVSNTIEFFPGMVKKWGLAGMITTEEIEGGRAAGSLTWGGIANTYFWIDPTWRVTGVLLTQIRPFADTVVLDLFAEFERAIYAAQTPAA